MTTTWEQRKLSEVVSFSGGHTPSMAIPENYSENGYMWITSQDVKSTYLESSTTRLSERGISKLKLFAPGTIVIVVRSGILRHTLPIAMVLAPSAVNQDIKALENKTNIVMPWLLYALKAKEKYLLREYSKTGTTVESMDSEKLKDFLIAIPTAKEQKSIGSYFTHLDSLITLHQC